MKGENEAAKLKNDYLYYLVITGAQYHWDLGTLHFPSCSPGSCMGQIQGQHGQFPSMVHQAGTLKRKHVLCLCQFYDIFLSSRQQTMGKKKINNRNITGNIYNILSERKKIRSEIGFILIIKHLNISIFILFWCSSSGNHSNEVVTNQGASWV